MRLRWRRWLLGWGRCELRLGRGGQRGGVWLLRWRRTPVVLLRLLLRRRWGGRWWSVRGRRKGRLRRGGGRRGL